MAEYFIHPDTRDWASPLLVSEERLDGYLEGLSPGLSRSQKVTRGPDGTLRVGDDDPARLRLQYALLRIASAMVPSDFTHGATHYRVIGPGAAQVNETHRDKGGAGVWNVTSLVCGDDTSCQLEFFGDEDVWEESPIVVPNGHVLAWQKTLHRRGGRPAGEHKRLFLSLNLHR